MQGEMDEEEYGEMVDPDYEKSRSFNQKSVMQKIGVIFAGPAMNFVLAFVLVFILIGVNGFLVPQIKSVVENSPAYEAGLEEGDKIIKMAREYGYIRTIMWLWLQEAQIVQWI